MSDSLEAGMNESYSTQVSGQQFATNQTFFDFNAAADGVVGVDLPIPAFPLALALANVASSAASEWRMQLTTYVFDTDTFPWQRKQTLKSDECHALHHNAA